MIYISERWVLSCTTLESRASIIEKNMYIDRGVDGQDEILQTVACESKKEMRCKEDEEK